MRISLESAKCNGHALCHAAAPDLFPIDDEGYCTLEAHTVAPGDEELARAGAAACPEAALFISGTDD
ncbi:ferredoxin [Mycolicibacterium anyangense]|uniref:Ferredoxin n=1 Tax=Mycolicibacterium anyangense TaxID=1431246 RepID=A0A6N4W491_9MYCO|nr:ferredoxin [Mycolicibacterium anyangense]BBZ74884.1 ferredoxin [Mycolicibacterium anyangense]